MRSPTSIWIVDSPSPPTDGADLRESWFRPPTASPACSKVRNRLPAAGGFGGCAILSTRTANSKSAQTFALALGFHCIGIAKRTFELERHFRLFAQRFGEHVFHHVSRGLWAVLGAGAALPVPASGLSCAPGLAAGVPCWGTLASIPAASSVSRTLMKYLGRRLHRRSCPPAEARPRQLNKYSAGRRLWRHWGLWAREKTERIGKCS